MKLGHQEEFYRAEEGRMLGSEEFVENTKHRMGEIPRGARPKPQVRRSIEVELLLAAVEEVTGMKRAEFCVPKKGRNLVMVKELMIMVGREQGASNAGLARIMGIDGSVVSRRYESAKARLADSDCSEARELLNRLREAFARKK
jgi:hypothetical protein